MILFGLLWVTSWIGSFLWLNQSFLPSIEPKVEPTKISTNLGKLVSMPHPFFVEPKQPIKIWSTTLLPTHFLKMDWGEKQSKPTRTQPPKSFTEERQDSKHQFCRSLQEIETKQQQKKTVKTSSAFTAATLIETTSTIEFLPNKILRSLQNFFRFSNPFEQSFGSDSLPVVVVNRDEISYEVWVNNRLIANLPEKAQATLMQQRLTQLLKSPNLNASQLRPALVDGTPALMAGNRFLFGIEQEFAKKANCSAELLAIEWINNLRAALQVPTLSLVEGQLEMYGIEPSKKKMYGLASWYGPFFHGRLTANGEIFNQNELTVAHKSLPFNTFLQVTNLKTGKAVIVRVNDRGPYIPPRSLDLSRIAARSINSELAGVVPYKAVIMQPNEPKLTLKNFSLTLRNQKPAKKLSIITDF